MHSSLPSKNMLRSIVNAGVFLLALGSSLAHAAPVTVAAADYARAERFLPGKMSRYVDNADIQHHWLEALDKFWDRRVNPKG